MTLDEARAHIDEGVVYTTGFSPPEDGVITGVSASLVFVLYAGDVCAKGTNPDDLTLLAHFGEAVAVNGPNITEPVTFTGEAEDDLKEGD